MCKIHGNYLGGNNWSMRSEVKKTLRFKGGICLSQFGSECFHI